MGSYKDGKRKSQRVGEIYSDVGDFMSITYLINKIVTKIIAGLSVTKNILFSDAKPPEIEAAIEKYLRENPSILKDKLKESNMEYKPQQLPDLNEKFKIFKKFWAKSKDEL